MREPEWAEIEGVVCIAETDAALLCEIGGEQKWIPKKLVSEESFVMEKGDEGQLLVAEWFALKEGIE